MMTETDVIAEVQRRLDTFHSPSFDRGIVEQLLALARRSAASAEPTVAVKQLSAIAQYWREKGYAAPEPSPVVGEAMVEKTDVYQRGYYAGRDAGIAIERHAQKTRAAATNESTGNPDDVDEAYELGKRDGYEDAIQDLDIATGGDGEFRGSTFPGATVDVPAMRRRIIDRCAALSPAPAGEVYRPVEIRNDEAGYVEFVNADVPFIVREIDGPAAILLDMETRNVIGYRVYDQAPAAWRPLPLPASPTGGDKP